MNNRIDRVQQKTDLDIAIFGGGIAGLWTLAHLQDAGYRVALFEHDALGGVQSIASQGIIHGGTKYALTGKLTGSAMAIGEMPAIWRTALAGAGEVDLRGVRLLSQHQYLWTTGSLASGVAGFFAGKVMHSRMRPLDREAFPAPFDDVGFGGHLYRLEEPVLDPRALMQVFADRYGVHCHKLSGMPALLRDQGHWCVELPAGSFFRARLLVLAAGRGNAELLNVLGHDRPRMQTRPLHMLMLRGALPPLYAHCLGASANPRLTVTSYPAGHGQTLWYLGGQVAEEGIARGRDAQIQAGRDELAELLPWVDFDDAQWATWRVERAEVAMPGGRRPDDVFVDHHDGVVTCWPTKLAFAPRVARLVSAACESAGIRPTPGDGPEIDLPSPPLARLPWDEEVTWS